MSTEKFSVKQILNMEACTRCGECTELCSAYMGSKDLKLSPPKKIELLKKRIWNKSIFGKLLGKKDLSEKEMEELLRSAYSCTLCSRCEVNCPINIDLKDMWISLRENMVSEERAPEQLELLRERLMKAKNISFDTNEGRTDWIKPVPEVPENMYIKKSAKVIYFVGCVSSFSPRTFKIPRSIVQILQSAEVDFGLLGDDEWCCGFPLMSSGFAKDFEEFAVHNIKKVNNTGARILVTACPSCYHMWSHIYPGAVKDIKMNFKVLHMVQYLYMLAKDGKIKLNPVESKVTYHDPCDLGRNSGIYDEPRDLIKMIPGVEFVELENNKEYATCCGGGGNVESIDTELSSNIASIKAKEIIATGADIVITACQQCVRTIATGLKKEKSRIKAVDLSQLVLDSIKAGS